MDFQKMILAALFIPMNGFRRKGREAYGDILGSLLSGRAVFHPFPGTGNDGFTGRHIQGAVFRHYSEHPLQNQRIFRKFRPLAGLFPSG